MEIERLMEEYKTVGSLLKRYNTVETQLNQAKENILSLENELASVREQLVEGGVKSSKIYIHEDCGGPVITFEDEVDSEIDICLECGVKGGVKKGGDGENYIRFNKPVRD